MANKTFARIPAHAWKMLLLSSVISGLAGSASAETFDIKGTVQKAVALNKVTDLNFGTIFTTKADAAETAYLTMSPAGVVSSGKSGDDAPPLIQMQAGTPGSYSSAALPAGSSVWIKLQHPDTSNDIGFIQPKFVAADANAAASRCAYENATEAVTAGRIVLSQGDFGAFFCVDHFTTNRAGLLRDEVTDTNTYSIGAATSLTFSVGATLVTQTDITVPDYLEGAYTGQYIMEINF